MVHVASGRFSSVEFHNKAAGSVRADPGGHFAFRHADALFYLLHFGVAIF